MLNNYIVIDDITVDVGDSLIIEPGAIILFSDNCDFHIFGYLYSVGTIEDSIIFAPLEEGETWRGINFWWLSDSSNILKYCYVTGSDLAGICFTNAEATVENCLIRGNDSGTSGAGEIACNYSSQPVIRNCRIIDNH